MFHLKLRYVSGQSVHAGNAEPGIIYTGEPFTCRGPVPFSSTNQWLANYEEILYSADKVRQFNDCRHTTFRGVPRATSSYDSWTAINFAGPWTSYGHNIHSKILATGFPHGDLDYNPFGVDRSIDMDNEKGMGGPVMAMLDHWDLTLVNQDKIASSALKLFASRFAKMNQGFSLINSLLELKDAKRFATKLKNLADKAEWHRLARVTSLEDIKSIGKDVASAYLEYKFGVCPFISDILSICRILANWRKRLKELLARVHKVNVAKATIGQYEVKGPLTNVNDYFGIVLCDGAPDYSEPPGRIRLVMPRGFSPRAGMKYSLYCEDLSRMNVELRALLDAFGVMWDPAIFWNALPFSFLLDWVYSVSEWFGKWAKPNLPLQLRVHDFYILWKYEGTVELETDHVTNGPDNSETIEITRTERTSVPFRRFRRVRFSPNYDHLIQAKWDKNVIDKTLLGGALVTTLRVAQPPVRIRRFGPSNLSLKKIIRALGR